MSRHAPSFQNFLKLGQFCLAFALFGRTSLASPTPLPIRNGSEVPPCGFPSVASILLEDGYCTATLIHPSVLLVAAHCGSGSGEVFFGDSRHVSSMYPRRKANCTANPHYQGVYHPASDWGYCILDTPVSEIPPLGILDACSFKSLAPYHLVWQAGYGSSAGTGKSGHDSGDKRWGQTIVTAINAAELSFVTSSARELYEDAEGWQPSSGCLGDSGGPALVQLADGTWHAIGILSTFLGNDCGGDNAYAMLDEVLAAIALDTGIDLRTCATMQSEEFFHSSCPSLLLSSLGSLPGQGSWKESCSASERAYPTSQCQAIWQDSSLLAKVTPPAPGGCALQRGSHGQLGLWIVLAAKPRWIRRRRWRFAALSNDREKSSAVLIRSGDQVR
jgi:hypothetical protein